MLVEVQVLSSAPNWILQHKNQSRQINYDSKATPILIPPSGHTTQIIKNTSIATHPAYTSQRPFETNRDFRPLIHQKRLFLDTKTPKNVILMLQSENLACFVIASKYTHVFVLIQDVANRYPGSLDD